jgi:hypothetical protein
MILTIYNLLLIVNTKKKTVYFRGYFAFKLIKNYVRFILQNKFNNFFIRILFVFFDTKSVEIK